jgi:hypothetical protein
MYARSFVDVLGNMKVMGPIEKILGEGSIVYAYTSSSMPPGGTNYSYRIHVDCHTHRAADHGSIVGDGEIVNIHRGHDVHSHYLAAVAQRSGERGRADRAGRHCHSLLRLQGWDRHGGRHGEHRGVARGQIDDHI